MVENHQELRNWLADLASHDPTDVRGILEAIAAVIRLIAGQLEPGPRTAPIPLQKGGES